jgi:hypothetical protein
MKSNKKKLFFDIGLLFLSYIILSLVWFNAVVTIFLPYANTPVETRPLHGIFVSFQNYFEHHEFSLFGIVLILLLSNIFLFWHRIAKRKESLDHVVQHTYVSNYGYIFLKTFFLFFVTLLPIGHTLMTSLPVLFEVYTIIFVHLTLIILLFLVHHKNIIFGKKYLTIEKYLK